MKKYYLIAGHGAGDPGASGNNYIEANVARSFVTDLSKKLGSHCVVYDQSKNLYTSQNYTIFDKNTHIATEIHLNSNVGTPGTGTELYIKHGYTADAVDKAMNNALGKYFQNRGIKSNLSLLNMNKLAERGVTYNLVELCFINNKTDMINLIANWDGIITDLANAMLRAIGSTDTVTSGGTNGIDTSTTTPSDTSTYTVKVTADELNIRAGAGTNYSIVGSIKDKGTYTIVETKGNWGKLKSCAGWISLSYTTKATNSSPSTNYLVRITATELNIRNSDSTAGKILGTVKRNEIYTIVRESNGWGLLKSGAGWICLDYTMKA